MREVREEHEKPTIKQIKKTEAQRVNTVSSLRERKLADQALKRGGPHDEEFFKCFIQYLNEAIS
jgi:hypothetical protein